MVVEAGPGLAGVLDAADIEAFFSAGHHLSGRPVVAIYTADGGSVRAGSFLYVEEDVETLVGGNHRMDWVATFPVREIYDLPGHHVGIPWSKGDIVIGHGVRLGRGSRVLSGLTIGDGAAVSPSSVVTRDVPPYTLVAGNPAREVGRRFDARIVQRLSQTLWWDWPDDLIVWRLDRLTRGRAHMLVPQLIGDTAKRRPEGVRRAAVHLMRERAHRLDDVDSSAAATWARRLRRGAARFEVVEGPVTEDGGVSGAPAAPNPPLTAPDGPAGGTQVPKRGPLGVPMGHGSYGWPIVQGPVERVTIGNYCSIAPESTVVVESGPVAGGVMGGAAVEGADDLISSLAWPTRPGGPEVHIGSDVWIGRKARILPGVTIGDGAVVAAYSVVTRDVRPFAVVAGDPAREVKRRFDDANGRGTAADSVVGMVRGCRAGPGAGSLLRRRRRFYRPLRLRRP